MRANAAIRNRAPPGEKCFLKRSLVGQARRKGDSTRGMLYIITHVFLLCAPSEGLQLQIGTSGSVEQQLPAGPHSALAMSQGRLVPRVTRRKTNRLDRSQGGTAGAKHVQCMLSGGRSHTTRTPDRGSCIVSSSEETGRRWHWKPFRVCTA